MDDLDDDAESGPSDTEVIPLQVVGAAIVAAAEAAAGASPCDTTVGQNMKSSSVSIDARLPAVEPTPLGASHPIRYFQVGEDVYYWSITHNIWAPATVIRVYQGQRMYDLDVKRKAILERIRPRRPGNVLDELD